MKTIIGKCKYTKTVKKRLFMTYDLNILLMIVMSLMKSELGWGKSFQKTKNISHYHRNEEIYL